MCFSKEEGEIEKNTLENVRKTPYTLFDQFEWADVDLNNAESVEEVLLIQNSVLIIEGLSILGSKLRRG